MSRIRVLFLLIVLVAGFPAAARAQVEIAFYSKDLASSFPHAYVRLTGTDDSGRPFDSNYGFTPARMSPAILVGAVEGMMQAVGTDYIARSDRHFSVSLTSEQYARVVAVIERWRDGPQPNYRLNGRNCVHFVADVAAAIGLDAPIVPNLMKKPKSYLEMVSRRNAALLARWPEPRAVLTERGPQR